MKVGEMHSKDLTLAIRDIMDVFTGADGGVEFVRFCSALREQDKLAKEGNTAARKITDVVRNFHTLLLLLSR